MKRRTPPDRLAEPGAADTPPPRRHTLFWRMFANYFLLILIPVIVASVLAQVLVVRIIEKDAERFNQVVMNRFSEQTDAELQSLKTSMINILSTSRLRSVLLAPMSSSPESQLLPELLHSLREQLQQLESDELVEKAYYYFVHQDLMIDAETYTNKAYYFRSRYPLDLNRRHQLEAELSGKKMMDFMDSPASVTASMSYPFNTAAPEVYLLVEVKRDKLEERIHIPESWVTGTAIVDDTAQVIAMTGLTEQDRLALQQRIRTDGFASQFTISDKMGLSFMASGFNESWHYISMVDLGTLMKPVHITRLICWLFLLFFLVVGALASYYLSRRLYRPIREIKDGLKLHHAPNEEGRYEGNEFDVIKRYSQFIMTENKELYQMVNGMLPIVQEQFFTKILLGQYRDALSIEYYAKEIEFAYSHKAARTVLCISFHYDRSFYDSTSESAKIFLLTELKDKIHRLAPGMVWICQTRPDLMACVIQHDHITEGYPERTAEQIRHVFLEYGVYYKATIGIGRTVHAIEELHQSYEHALAMLNYRGLHSTVEICGSPPSRELQQWDSFLSVQEVQRIHNQCKTREYDKLLHSVLDLLEEGKRKDAAAVQMKYLLADVLNTWIRAVESERNELNVPYYSGLFERMNRCMTWDELTQCFQDIHGFLFRKPASSSRSQQFMEILEYIHEHYDQELSIEHFAGMMNMSIGHFSRTFKEEVGEKYVEYIAKYRLMKAKQFLLETDLKIDEIAEKVGYWGRNSLIRAFRRYEGITPAKYRSSHQ
ncbi:helix-turn-helix domain-containing protein [Paenibacillus sp. Y412MC10]|uniref:helix-turn-helix domain-containing protein n=1 Tax=Geobacillus sp. (strain Y412MC10) TaxID=481743 RepID=UPI0001789459|nr:helix-turn-helix domain-containing protein [Paenibacillus sp. Y412MC10]ACX63551.1 transcriptional regulator, AraC family [Paenibacillus sp. Y412MC10]